MTDFLGLRQLELPKPLDYLAFRSEIDDWCPDDGSIELSWLLGLHCKPTLL